MFTRREFLASSGTLAVSGCTAPGRPERGYFHGSVHSERFLNRPHDVRLRGDYAYVPGKGGTFAVVDVSDPSSPSVVGGLRKFENAQTVLIPSESICLLGAGAALYAIDISNPTRPSVVHQVAAEGLSRINGWELVGEDLLVSSKDGYLVHIDISDPAAPEHRGRMPTPALASPHDATVVNGRLVTPNQMEDSTPKLGIYDIFGENGVRPVSEWERESTLQASNLNGANRIVARDEYVFVAGNYSHTVGVVDVSDPSNPVQVVNRSATGEGVDGLALKDDILLAGASTSIDGFDISDPAEMTKSWTITDKDHFGGVGCAHDLEVRDGLIYASAQKANRLNIYELPAP